MKLYIIYTTILFAALIWMSTADDSDPEPEDVKIPKKLQIGVKKRAENCKTRSKKGDTLHMQYRGTLFGTNEEFDSSYSRNQPFIFTLGTGQVIKGWDQGLIGMCEGDERKLVVPPELGYGARGAPPKIPPNSALVFHVVLDKIERHGEL